MRTTTVKSLAVVARRKTYHTGATVSESWFQPGEFDRLISAGHLNPVAEEKAPEVPAKEPVKEPVKIETDVNAGSGKIDDPDKTKEDEDDETGGMSIGELRKALKDKGIKYEPTAKKEDLIKLLAQS